MTTSSDDPRSSLPTVTNTTSNNDRSKNNVDCAPFDNTTAATGAPDDDTTATAATSTSSAMEVTCTSSSATVETSMSCPITLVTSTPSPVTLVTSTPSPATLVPSTSTPATLVGATFTLTTIDSSIISTTSDDEINIKIEKQDNSGKSDINNSIFGRSCENRHAMNSGIKISTGTGFSPSSVLQVLGCKDSRFKNNINDTELQPGRCRRTDGKKWRCRRDVLPDQKYCARHMHRGAKRSVLGSLPVTDPVSSVPMNSGARLPPPATEPKTNTANTAIQKRNLTSPISTSHQQIDGEEKSLRSSDSETTISDTKSN
ncbi:Growth-regulating factor [Quillaja saponaria]|uniref:Growth-regulating factor n=1 Tax=Quillaja saponaria TaxID=32244 RepID=A0AAD7LPZ1_QUISA|nr:Growth-regulating factor [Quillaja saponaria]